MTILPRGPRPASGSESWTALDDALLFGFLSPFDALTPGRRRTLASRMRARVYAVDAWVAAGAPPTRKSIASAVDMSDRWLSTQFPRKTDLYAFPPPELARSCAVSSAQSKTRSWDDIANCIRPVFVILQENNDGRRLMAGLVQLYEQHTDLNETNSAFATELRKGITWRRPRKTLSIADLFAGGLRLAFEDWVEAGQPDTTFVADRVEALVVGPIAQAYGALTMNLNMETKL
jgi:hypothetical protein